MRPAGKGRMRRSPFHPPTTASHERSKALTAGGFAGSVLAADPPRAARRCPHATTAVWLEVTSHLHRRLACAFFKVILPSRFLGLQQTEESLFRWTISGLDHRGSCTHYPGKPGSVKVVSAVDVESMAGDE